MVEFAEDVSQKECINLKKTSKSSTHPTSEVSWTCISHWAELNGGYVLCLRHVHQWEKLLCIQSCGCNTCGWRYGRWECHCLCHLWQNWAGTCVWREFLGSPSAKKLKVLRWVHQNHLAKQVAGCSKKILSTVVSKRRDAYGASCFAWQSWGPYCHQTPEPGIMLSFISFQPHNIYIFKPLSSACTFGLQSRHSGVDRSQLLRQELKRCLLRHILLPHPTVVC